MATIESVLIVEDLPQAADWLGQAVRSAFKPASVIVASDLAQARRALDEKRFDLALVDLGLPDGDGTRLIERIKQLDSRCVCVVASTFADDEHLFPALKAGADGYFTKDQGPEALAEVLEGIVHGQPPLSPGIARRLLEYFHQPAPPAHDLSPREVEVLTLVGKGLSTGEVGSLLGISRHTAAGYVKEVYRKLEISSRAEAALKAVDLGLVGRLD